jgi:Tetracyclin repressor-like, C-terminal domain
VAKILRLPWTTPEFIDRIITGSINEAGRRMLYMLITTWDRAGGGPFAGSAIAATGLAKTVDIVQSQLSGPVLGRMLRALGADEVKLRAALCASQLVGIGVMRYAARTEPIHSMDVDALVRAVAPTLQRYLTGDLT